MDAPKLYLVIGEKNDLDDSSPNMVEALHIYFRLKASNDNWTLILAEKRIVRCVAEALGNKPIALCSSFDASAFRDYLFDKGLALGSVQQVVGSVRHSINLVMLGHVIEGSTLDSPRPRFLTEMIAKINNQYLKTR